MSKTAEELNQQHELLWNGWTYFDVLALGLAESNLEEFDADPARWNRTIAGVKTEYPHIFNEIFFDRRDPESPWSEEVERFLDLMVRSGSLKVASSFRQYEMKSETRDQIKLRLSPRLETVRNVVDAVAKAAAAQLGTNYSANGELPVYGG